VTPGVAVKCASVDMADMLRDTGLAGKAPYFHRSWVLLPDDVADGELTHRILASYDLIRAALPAATRQALPPRQSEA
jgi:predicted DNA-binding protein (MmcQ/YjbR family)